MKSESRNGDNLDCLVRLWLVVEEDRGMGASVLDAYPTQHEAELAATGSHTFVDYVDMWRSRLCELQPNDEVSG